jgi:hypothetical protein
MTNPEDEGEDARVRRAERLRKRIADLANATGDNPERQPGESDKEYVERRTRELSRKPPRDG